MAGLIWLWNQGGAAPDNTALLIAADPNYTGSAVFFEELEDTVPQEMAVAVTTAMDVAPFLSIPAAPPATVEVLVAADPDYYGIEMDALYPRGPPFDDYANDTTLDVTPAFFPPAAVEPIETFAAQPLAEQPWFPGPEVEDYEADPEQNEWTAPPEIVVPELIAAQPHFGEWVWDAEQTDDYQAESSLDTTPTLFPTAAEPVETFAAQPLAEQAWFDGEIVEDYGTLPEQLEFLAPPEVPTTELAAAQPHYGEAFWPAEETEDYQHDATLDPTPTFFPTAAEAIEVFAAQPHYGEWWFEDQPTEDYAADSTIEVPAALIPPPLSDVEAQAAAQLPEYDFAALVPVETEDYANDTALDVPVLAPVPANAPQLIASGYSTFYGDVEAVSPETLEDYQHLSVLELTFAFAQPPPAPVFLSEGDADALATMQGDGSAGAALEPDAEPTAGTEGDGSTTGALEGDTGDVIGLEG